MARFDSILETQDNNGQPLELEKSNGQESPTKPKKIVSANFVRTSEIQPKPVEWLWPERIARGKITLVCGNPGLGKSFLTCDIAARVSKGKAWPDGAEGCSGSVLMLSAEDDPADTIVPRLISADADRTKIEILKSIQVQFDAVKTPDEKFFNLADDIPVLRDELAERPDCKLVCIDPLSAYLAGTDTHKNSDVRSVLAPLAQLASEHNIAVVCIDHLNKRNQTSAAYRVAGSIAFSATARCVHFIVRDEHDPETRLMLPMKNNLVSDVSGLSFKLHTYAEGSIPCLSWSQEPVNVSLDDVLEKQSSGRKGEFKTDKAVEWLRSELKNGKRPSKELLADGREHGFTERPMRNAAKRLNIEPAKDDFNGIWYWELPSEDDIQDFHKDDLFPL